MSFSTSSFDHTGRTVGHLTTLLGSTPLTLVAVWAHPDDESYLGAGLMAEIVRRGGRVVNVTATLGEHGTDDPVRDRPQTLAARRRAELASALDTLGVDTGIELGFEDGTCHEIPDEVGARRVAGALAAVRPDVVLGFGADGVTGHPDHRAVGRWTHRALTELGTEIPLLNVAAGATWPADLIPRMHRVGAFWPGFPQRDHGRGTWRLTLDERQVDQKLAALACHRSQIGPLRDALGDADYRRLAAVESYRAANRAAHDLMFAPRAAVAA